MARKYRVVLTLKAQFRDPVDMPYGPAQPSRFEAVSTLMTALALHGTDAEAEWSGLSSIRIDIED